MGKIDIEAKKYFSDFKRFADVFNFWIYKGEPVIQPDAFSELDSTEITLAYSNNVKLPIQKFRDLLNLYISMKDNKAIYILFGLEIEAKTHYAMPARNMLYDAINYMSQIQKIADTHNDNSKKNITGDEYISGFWKEDYLIPVITLTINISGNKWDGANSLHEMFRVNDQMLLRLVPNYYLNLLSPDAISDDDFDKFHTGIGSLMQFIKHKDDKSMDWIKGKKRFEHVDRRTADLIQTVTGTKMKFKSNEEVVNMCKAWENSMEEAKTEGKNEGIKEGILGEKLETAKRLLSKNFSLDIIQEATDLTIDQIKSCVE